MPFVENILPDDVVNGIQDMSKKQQITTDNVEIKEKPNTSAKETPKTERVSYDKKDLERMDRLLKSIEEE